MTIRLRIDLAYHGAGFSGWAIQPGLTTVQGELELALARALRMQPGSLRTVVAGRTDSGVHAIGQVCHVDVEGDATKLLNTPAAQSKLLKRLRGALGKNSPMWISSLRVAPDGFDARFSAMARRYEYRIADSQSFKDPRQAAYTLWIDDGLDDEAMSRLGASLVGLHDFASFCRARPSATTIRELQEMSFARDGDGVLVATVRADAFCHSMVRSLLGAALAVGRGILSVAEVTQLRDAAQRTSAWTTQAAHGLTLCEVIYPRDDELGSRAEQTRALREGTSD